MASEDNRENRPSFNLSCFRFTFAPRDTIRLPRMNKGITLRGAFGSAFRALVCVDRAAQCNQCAVRTTCPYGFIFEPHVPPDAERLRLNRDIPRPFVIKPPLDQKEIYAKDEPIRFDLVMIGKARDFLPYFLVSFRELGERGIGVGRGRFDIERIEAAGRDGKAEIIFHKDDPLVRVADAVIRFEDLALPADPPKGGVRVHFLTPILLKDGGEFVLPRFGPLMRRLRDRIQALGYFYCGATMEMDFQGFGEAADSVKTLQEDLRWVEEDRYSRHRDLTHTLKGYIGKITFQGDLAPFLPFLRLGEYIHVGKAAVFGQGWYRIENVDGAAG